MRSSLLRARFFLCAIPGFCALFSTSSVIANATYNFTSLDDPLATAGTQIFGISGNLIVGGYSTNAGGSGEHGFIYNGSSFVTVDVPSNIESSSTPIESSLNAVSNNIFIGNYIDHKDLSYGFTYNGTTFSVISDPSVSTTPASGTTVSDISGSIIVGYYTGQNSTNGFIYDGTNYTDIIDPLATGSVSGTMAYGISGNTIVGSYFAYDNSTSTTDEYGFIYNGSTYATLSFPGAMDTVITAISGNDMVGWYSDAGGPRQGFLYDGSTFTPLDDPLAGGPFPETTPTGIDGSTVVGYYTGTDGLAHGFIATPVPEPTSGIFLLVGTMALLRRRRRNSVCAKTT